VFSAPGLRVLAAPWGYALMTKFDRMASGGGKRMILTMLLTTFTNEPNRLSLWNSGHFAAKAKMRIIKLSNF
jgi:hypothetical protein